MKKNLLIFLLNFFPLCFLLSQQSESDLKETFLAAESYYLFEEYNEALPLYLNLNKAFPDNSNYHFKIGVCYLNNPFEKDKSIYYLEKAIKNISPRYKENSFKETSAPLEAFFYLGNAYRINNQLRKAREYYNKFVKELDPSVYDIQLVKDQLSACTVAENLMKKPVDFDLQNLGEPVNTRFSDMNPVVSGDETKMTFISKLQFYDAVFYTEKVDGKWTLPRNIVPELGVDGDVYPTSLSFDGKEMFIYRNDDYTGNLYTSKLVNGKWTPLVKLNDNINTKYWESHASLSRDGNTLYFTSNRKDSYGGLDIYYSRKQPNDDWGPAKNLGPSVNTKYNEETPFITEDGKKLFFSSYGHYNMGGYDVFMSIRIKDTVWAKPVNIGYPINTTDDNVFFHPLANGQVAYYSVFEETGLGRNDIYRYVLYSPDNPRKFSISGLLDYSGQTVRGSEIDISVVDPIKGNTIARVNPDDEGKFRLELPAGKYNLIIDSDKFQKSMFNLIIQPTAPHSGITLPDPIQLRPPQVILTQEEMDKLLQIADTFILVKNNRPVVINYTAQRGSQVNIDVYHGSDHISSDALTIYSSRQSFRFNPKSGTNKVIITLDDGKGNIVRKSVTVIKKIPDALKETETTIADITGIDSISDVQETNRKVLLELYRHQLADKSDSALREVLKMLDLEKEGINTSEELNKYLYDNAERLGYPVSDIDKLLENYHSDQPGEIDKLRLKMAELSSGALRAYLLKMNPRDYDFKSGEQFIRYLQHNADSLGFKEEDVNTVLHKLSSKEDLKSILNEMILKSSGNLQKLLKDLDTEREGIKTYDELIRYLLDNADKYSYSKEDGLRLIQQLSSSESLQDFVKRMKQYARGNLKNILDTLDLQRNGIFNIDGLINYLISQSEKLGITPKEIWDILTRLAMEEIKKPVEKTILMEKASPPEKNNLFYILGAIGALVIILFLIWLLRKKRKKKE